MKKIEFLRKVFYVLLLLSSVILILVGIGGFIYFFTNLNIDVLFFSMGCGVFSLVFGSFSQVVKIND